MLNRSVSCALLADSLPVRFRGAAIRLDRGLDLAPRVGCSIDYGTLADLIIETSARLAAGGVRAEDRVAVIKTNGADVLVLALACQRLGAVPALISASVQGSEAAQMLGILRPRLLVTDRATLADGALSDLDPDLFAARACVVDDPGPRGLPEPLRPIPSPVAPTAGDQQVLITHSSGTTGTPKLCVQTLDSFEATAAINRKLVGLLRLKGPIGVSMSAVHLRTVAGIAALMRLGVPLLYISDPEPQTALALLAEVKPTVVEAHPASFVDWEPYITQRPDAFARVQHWSSNFDAVHPRTVKALLAASKRRMPFFVSAYGQSESGPITTRADTRFTAQHADGRCVGYPILGFSHFRIGKARDGRTGPIEVRSKGLAADYLGRGELYDSKRDGDWWDMGDLGFRSRYGCLHLMDRAIDAAPGVPSLLAIEDSLMGSIPGLREAVLIAVDDGPPVPLLATYDGTRVPDEVWRKSIATLPALGDPLFCSYDSIPRTATGKVQRLRTLELLRSGTPPGAP